MAVALDSDLQRARYTRNVVCGLAMIPALAGLWWFLRWGENQSGYPNLFFVVFMAVIFGLAFIIDRPARRARRERRHAPIPEARGPALEHDPHEFERLTQPGTHRVQGR